MDQAGWLGVLAALAFFIIVILLKKFLDKWFD